MNTKRAPIWILSTLVGFASVAGAALDYRTFSNKEGVEIKAALVAVRDGRVTLRKEDGKTYAIPLDTLSEVDKDYVKRWREENIHISLDMRFEKEKLGTRKGDQKESTEWLFNVTITNRGFNDLEGVTFKYAIFKDLHDRYAKDKNAVVDALVGTVEPRNLPRTKSFSFKTGAMRVDKENSKTYKGLIDGVKQYEYKKWDESLCGITVEVYLKDKLVDRKEFGKIAPLRPPTEKN